MEILKKIRDRIISRPISLGGDEWAGIFSQGLRDGINKPTIPLDEHIEELVKPRRVAKSKEDSIMIDNNHETKLGGTDMERKNKDTLDVYEELLESIHQTYISKNADYGNSFGVSLDKRGLVAAVVRMEDKLNRLDQLKDGEQNLVGESLMDTALDLANYALMTAVWLNQQEKETYKVYVDNKLVAEFPEEVEEDNVENDIFGLRYSPLKIKPTKTIELTPNPTPIKGTKINIEGGLGDLAYTTANIALSKVNALESTVSDINKLVRDILEIHEKGRDCNE